MPVATSARIHPTAILSSTCRIADDVAIGPHVVIEGNVEIGPGCVIRPFVHLIGTLRMGRGNQVYSGAVLGERPQHLKFADEETRVEIGDHNVIREHVTIHRGTTDRYVTVIGSRNFLMAGSHIAHDCVVGDYCTLANGALVGGHCILDDRCILAGNAAVHQRCRIGRLAMLGGISATSKDVPPFIIQQGINCVAGVNVIGLERAGVAPEAIQAIKQAYRRLFKDGLTTSTALARIEAESGQLDEIQELVSFIRNSSNGINAAKTHLRTEWA
jgi:UDP-N-acetylglucosamine acyltransferase